MTSKSKQNQIISNKIIRILLIIAGTICLGGGGVETIIANEVYGDYFAWGAGCSDIDKPINVIAANKVYGNGFVCDAGSVNLEEEPEAVQKISVNELRYDAYGFLENSRIKEKIIGPDNDAQEAYAQLLKEYEWCLK